MKNYRKSLYMSGLSMLLIKFYKRFIILIVDCIMNANLMFQNSTLMKKLFFYVLLVGLLPACSAQKELPMRNSPSDMMMTLLSDTPIEEDLQELCDRYGGRVTGTDVNLASVDWAVRKFEEAGVSVKKEAFTIPSLWIENGTIASVTGATEFTPKVVAKYYSKTTPKDGLKAKIIDVGFGTDADFAEAGTTVKGNYVLVEADLCLDVDGLFKEYSDAAAIDARAAAAGAVGIINMSSRPKKLLYRFIASDGPDHGLVNIVMAREDAFRCQRMLRNGDQLDFDVTLNAVTETESTSYNVIAEIKGSEMADEYVLIGAHLDSWGLGTGANDNGCNVSMMIDIARQMQSLGIQPKRTIRFALWNAEEQGYFGSWGYTKSHQAELDKHIMAMSVDIGSGGITGFFSNGRPEMAAITEKVMKPVSGLGAKTVLDIPIVGTDNFDFMLEGVGNLIANHKPFNYGVNYHASSDTYDKVDLESLKRNTAIVASVALGFANLPAEEVTWKRQSPEEIAKIISDFNLEFPMRMFGVYEAWERGERGRH